MASQSAAFAGAAPDQSALGWLVAIPLGCLVLMQALLALTGIVPILEGALADSDAYMRLARVLHLHDGGAWFDPREPRVNPPEAMSGTGRGRWMRCCWRAPGCCNRFSASSVRCTCGAC
jgi:hypothetical protein